MDRQHAIVSICRKRGFTIVSISKKTGIDRKLLSDYCRFQTKDDNIDKQLMSMLPITENEITQEIESVKVTPTPVSSEMRPQFEDHPMSDKCKKQMKMLDSLINLATIYYE